MDMRKKTYRSSAGISINVRMKSGHYKHVCFDMQSNGTSIFVTDSENLIEALDNDKRCGNLYTAVEEPAAAALDEAEAGTAEHKVKEVEVECLADAKEWLARECGVPRSVMRSKTSILLAAKENDIVFVGNLE